MVLGCLAIVVGIISALVERPAKDGDPIKRFAFVKVADGTKDRMFMPSSLDPSVRWEALRAGDRVEFDDVVHEKGLRAAHVRLVIA
jgi:cold shock CspA family protein